MNPHLHRVYHYLRHRFGAQGNIRLHSPFVFEFYQQVLHDKRHYYAFKEIEDLRLGFIQSKDQWEATDLGTGTKEQRSLSNIARHVAAPPKLGQLLFRMVEHYRPAYILETGTSLGIGTRYMASPGQHKCLVSIEGDPQTLNIAKRHLQGFDKIHLIQADLNDLLPNLGTELQSRNIEMEQIDFAFLDANHSYDASIRYFENILPLLHSGSIVVLDDIYWSAGMTQAWHELCLHNKVCISIDLYRCGILLFDDRKKDREHFKLKSW
jgi:predicted O-methyltransferase YrrM